MASNVETTFSKITTTNLVNWICEVCQMLMPITMARNDKGELIQQQGFYPYQVYFAKRLIRSILENDGEEITALFARQSGKSETVACVTAGLMIILPVLANLPMFANDSRLMMFREGFLVGIFAPIQNQSQLTFNKIRARLSSRGARQLFDELRAEGIVITYDSNNGVNVVLTNGSKVTCRSASEGSNIEGESFMLLIAEECQDISNYKIRKSLHPMLAAYNGTIVKIGTPNTVKGDFYEAIQRNKDRLKAGKIARRNHFEFNYKTVMKYNPKYEKYIQKEIYRLGENSDEFQMSYNLKWILERGMFVSPQFLEDYIYSKQLDRIPKDLQHIHVAGIDFGKKSDSTIVTIVEVDWDNPVIVEEPKSLDNMQNVDAVNYGYTAYHVTVKDWLELQGDDYETQYPLMLEFLQNYNLARIVADGTGAGAPIVDRLAANMECEVVPFAFSTTSKSALYKHLNAEFRGKRVTVPGCPEVRHTLEWRSFDKQFQDLQKGYSGSNMIVSHPGERDSHDDYPDSLALAVWGARTEGMGVVQITTKNELYGKLSPRQSSFYRARNSYTARRRG